MHLGHERAGGIEDIERPALGLLLHHARHAVGAENHRGAVRHLVQFIDEYRADGAQAIHDVLVVDDFVAHVDRRAEQHDGPLDDVDGAVHTGAESAGIG